VWLKVFTLSKPLLAGLTYPYDWGFVPSTKAETAIRSTSSSSTMRRLTRGSSFNANPLASSKSCKPPKEKRKAMTEFLRFPDCAPFEGDLQDIRGLPKRAIEELEKFFEATNALENKKLEFLGWHGPARAIEAIRKHSR
jgi:inorganic pyrophosphatase